MPKSKEQVETEEFRRKSDLAYQAEMMRRVENKTAPGMKFGPKKLKAKKAPTWIERFKKGE